MTHAYPFTSNDKALYQSMVDKHYLKEEEKNKEFFWVGRLLVIACSQTKLFRTSHFQNIFQNKYFVYILNDTRIIAKLPYIGIFKNLSKHSLSTNIFKTKYFVYILNNMRIIAMFSELRRFQNIFKLTQTQSI